MDTSRAVRRRIRRALAGMATAYPLRRADVPSAGSRIAWTWYWSGLRQRCRRRRGGLTQRFSAGWAAVNIGTSGAVTFRVPDGLVDSAGDPAPKKVRLQP